MPMVGLCVPPRVAIAKVDISLLLGSHDEEEKKTTATPATATTTTTVSAASESSRESAAPEGLVMEKPTSSRPLENIQEEPATPTVTSSSIIGTKRPQTDDPPGQPSNKRQSKWSAEEDALIIELRGQGMKWDHISKRLPGRSPISCRLHYQNYLERRSEWDEDKKNKLARLYER